MPASSGPILITLDSRVRLPRDDLPLAAAEQIRQEHSHRNPEHARLMAMGRRPPRDEPHTIRTWAHEGVHLTVPRGGMGKVRNALRAAGVAWTVDDRRCAGELPMGGWRWPKHLVTLRPDQERLVEAMLRRENVLVRSGMGSGKTCAVIGAIVRIKRPSLVVVWSGGLFDQWIERFTQELGIPSAHVGRVRGEVFDPLPITVAMQQTVARVEDERFWRMWGVVAADECQRSPARTYFPSIDPFPARWRIGVSGDEKRKDRKEFLSYDLFGEPAAEVTMDSLVDAGHVLDAKVSVLLTGFHAPWYRGGDTGYTRLLEEMSRDEQRNAEIAKEAATGASVGRQVLVLSARREHCVDLAARLVRDYGHAGGWRVGLLLGGPENAAEFAKARSGLRDGSIRVGVGTVQAVGTGIDIPNLSLLVVATPLAANKQLYNQAKGRVCRLAPGKTDAHVVYFWDHAVFGERHLRNLAAWNRSVRVLEGDTWVTAKEFLRHASPAPEEVGLFSF